MLLHSLRAKYDRGSSSKLGRKMKTIGILFILALLTGCLPKSTVTVGQNRIRNPNAITDYSFYSHEIIKYHASLPEAERHGILSITK
jgi:hypothetical protein